MRRTHSTCAILATSHVSAHGGDIAPGHLLARLLDLVARHRPGCHRPAAHLTTELPAIFGFLLDRTLDAKNWRAEQALRPAVVNRKVRDGALLQECPRRRSARLHAAPPTLEAANAFDMLVGRDAIKWEEFDAIVEQLREDVDAQRLMTISPDLDQVFARAG